MKNLFNIGKLLEEFTNLLTILATKKWAGFWLVVIFVFIGLFGYGYAKLFDPNHQRVPVPVPIVDNQCSWLIDQNKQLIDFITSPRRYNRKAVDSIVQMDSLKKVRSGLSE